MPKEISHIYFAEEIQKGLRPKIQEILETYKNIYYYGSTAPDLFYYYLPLKKEFQDMGELDIGQYIHDNKENMNPIYKLIQWAKDYHDDRLFTFVAGYLTHVASDTIFHPYIYSITGHYYNPDIKLQKLAQRNHRIFETKMDIFILNHIYKINLKQFQLEKKLFLNQEQKEVIKQYAIAVHKSFFPALDQKKMIEFSLFCYQNHLTLVKLFQNKPLINFLTLIRKFHSEIEHNLSLCYGEHLDQYQVNLEHFEPAPHPITGEMIQGNLYEFTESIKERGILFIESAYDFFTHERLDLTFLKKQIPHYSLDSGLIQISHSEMKYFKPLPTFNPI